MKVKLFVGIPTLNRADLLNPALLNYFKDFKNCEICIVDNGDQSIQQREKNFKLIKNMENAGVAKSWNMLLKRAFETGCTHALILNDDIYLGKNQLQIVDLIEQHLDVGFFVTKNHWCAFIISKETFETVGDFDENFFPAYFEDNDYCYRMTLNNVKRLQTEFLNPVIFRNSMTIAKDPRVNNGFEANRAYFIKKWGGAPTKEVFKTAFNL